MGTRLFVGNLPYSATDDEIRSLFSEHGTIVDVHLATDRETGRPRGFGFVSFSSEQEAQKAAEALNGHSLGGRALAVNIARDRNSGPPPRAGLSTRPPRLARGAPGGPPLVDGAPPPEEEAPRRTRGGPRRSKRERERGTPRRRHLIEEEEEPNAGSWRRWLDEAEDET
ncbi:MAG: RNA-binding protein [Acidobacteriota bacterium]|nr:MAG: RNA-binding protein [Acidobacteriota bacterium]